MKKKTWVGSVAVVMLFANCSNPTDDDSGKDESHTVLKSNDIVLEKGVETPKGTFILKDGESEADYLKTGSGPWEFSELSKRAATGTNTLEASSAWHYYIEITLIAGNNQNIECPNGGSKLNVDLNRLSGGYYLYLCGKESDWHSGIQPSSLRTVALGYQNPPATYSDGIKGEAAHMQNPLSNSDMNQGAGGSWVYGYYNKHGNSCNINGIGIRYKDYSYETIPPVPSGWRSPSQSVDLNAGAGGSWLYLYFRTINNCWQ